MITAETAGLVEEGEPIGPSEADEAEMRESGTNSQDAPAAAPRAPAKKKPTLDSLISRIPPETRAALDEELRARFMRVRQIEPGELR